jgi:outer membrane protein OmpA-like peptidoglycan-associated protein
MAANLIDMAKGLIAPELVDKAAAATGEPPAAASKALHGAVSSVFAAVANRSSTPEGASAVMAMVQQHAPSNAIFGERAESASEALASSSGIKSSSASKILELAAPLVLGVLGKEVASRGMNASGLSQLLSSHRTAPPEPTAPAPTESRPGAASATAPSGWRGIEERATSRLHGLEQQAATRFRDVEQRAAAVSGERSPWKLIVPAAAVLGMVIVGIVASTHHRAPAVGVTNVQPPAPATPTMLAPETGAAPGGPTAQAPSAPAPPATRPPASAWITLPNGRTLDVGTGTPEARLTWALTEKSVPLPRTFRFDELSFAPGSTELSSDADKTLDDLAAVLNAYPSARVRIEGHSGKVGSPAVTRALSASRARAIKERLVARGIAPDRIDTTRGGQARAGRAESGSSAHRRAEIVLLRR